MNSPDEIAALYGPSAKQLLGQWLEVMKYKRHVEEALAHAIRNEKGWKDGKSYKVPERKSHTLLREAHL
jgi:hypothetical protein